MIQPKGASFWLERGKNFGLPYTSRSRSSYLAIIKLAKIYLEYSPIKAVIENHEMIPKKPFGESLGMLV